MSTSISDQNNNDKRGLDDLDWINELYTFLQGKGLPEGVKISESSQPKLDEYQARSVIWFLQEHLRVLPDNISQCDNCRELYDENSDGSYTETPVNGMYNFCGCCDHLIPDNETNN